MSLVIRLQGLPAIANSVDIRQFFSGLNIPRGGVYITGGKYGEAFIVFSSYEESRHAVSLSGRILKDSCIRLTYSSEEEMRHALEIFQLGLKPAMSSSSYNPAVYQGPERNSLSGFSYVYVHGMPIKVTKVEIREFFAGLLVEDVLFMKFGTGIRNGNAIVKFGRSTDASEALKLHSFPLFGSPVTLKLSNEVEWIKNGGPPSGLKQRSPPRYSSRERQRTRTRTRSRSRSPIHRRPRRRSPYVRNYYVHIINISYRADKKDIKKFFFDLDMKDSQITFLVDKEGTRTREGFAMFTTEKDYRRALSLDKAVFKDHTVTIIPISKRDMDELINRMKTKICKVHRSPSRSERERRYLYLRNFPCDVTKADIQKFFIGKDVKEEYIVLLLDSKGVGLGEALIKFADEREAYKAENNNKKTHLGIKILISRINEDQKKALQEANHIAESVVTEADDMTDFTSDSIPILTSSVETPPVPPSVPPPVNGEPPAPESSQVGEQSKSETVPPSDKESKTVEESNTVVESEAMDKSNTVVESEAKVESDTMVESEAMEKSDSVQETPVIQSDPENTEKSQEDASVYVVETPSEKRASVKSDVTLLFIRNLPTSVTAAEILDFFHDFKLSSVDLKNIERGIATVRIPTFAEAVTAIEKLNKKEVGQKQVYVSLI